MALVKLFSVLLLGALVLWGNPAYAGQELIVSAAASLTNAFPEIGKLFEKQLESGPRPSSRCLERTRVTKPSSSRTHCCASLWSDGGHGPNHGYLPAVLRCGS